MYINFEKKGFNRYPFLVILLKITYSLFLLVSNFDTNIITNYTDLHQNERDHFNHFCQFFPNVKRDIYFSTN